MKILARIRLFAGLMTGAAVIVIAYSSIAFSQELHNVDSKRWTDKYDEHFRKYSKRFFGVGFDWKWFKSQAIAESSLIEEALSWVGAKGVMQIVPRTFEEIKSKNPAFADINEPRWNIAAGIYYDSQQYKGWNNVATTDDRLSFTFASYNAGRSTILNAQRVSKQEGFPGISWQDIETVAPRVARWRHDETIGYVRKIFELMNKTGK